MEQGKEDVIAVTTQACLSFLCFMEQLLQGMAEMNY